MARRVYSQQFDDIYFSPEDGVAESEYVFLKGNNLPQAWAEKPSFTIAETGFGTGLNFLLTWKIFEETASEDQILHYISFEKFPLSAADLKDALSGWDDTLEHYLDRLLACYPLRIPGFHRVQLSKNVFLTLIFDDVNDALPQLIVPQGVNGWYLDGFAPSKNPDMWSEKIFREMARLSAEKATFATFTAAGFVKRGLTDAGFDVRKEQGYGRKRERLCGRYTGIPKNACTKPSRPNVAVIGGGLAGTSCAYVLKDHANVTIFERSETLAADASGNLLGLCNPRFSALRNEESDFYMAAFAQAYRSLSVMKDIDFNPCGTLHLINNDEKEKRFRAMSKNWGWSEDHMKILPAAGASDVAGVNINHEALYLPDAAYVSPQKLCNAYADGVDVRLETDISTLKRQGDKWLVNGDTFDAVILACGQNVTKFKMLAWLPLYIVRGQLSYIKETDLTRKIKSNLCYGGSLSVALNGQHVLGSTFQRLDGDINIREEDHVDNLQQLSEHFPDLAKDIEIMDGRAALRCSSKDRFPVVGAVPDKQAWANGEESDIDGLYISTSHGSYGIVSTLAAAHMIADDILQHPNSLSKDTKQLLNADRFLRREKRKGYL